MKLFQAFFFISQTFFLSVSMAHGPTPQKIDESLLIDAPIDEVWQIVSQFDQLANWHPMVDKVTMIDDATRVLHLKGKGSITDSLDEMEAARHYLSYRLYEEDISVFPVSFYTISLELITQDSQTKINWNGRFYRADTGNFPAKEYSDEAAVKAMTDFATTGMSSLKSLLEAK